MSDISATTSKLEILPLSMQFKIASAFVPLPLDRIAAFICYLVKPRAINGAFAEFRESYNAAVNSEVFPMFDFSNLKFSSVSHFIMSLGMLVSQ